MRYLRDENFSDAVIRKITTGKNPCQVWHAREFEDELADALVEDNSLFVEEEQNLYVDEVRDAQMWIGILMTGTDELWEEAQTQVATWAFHSLCAIEKVTAERMDGPYGWTSKPQVFALCARVILAARAQTALLNVSQGERYEDLVRIDLLVVGKRLWKLASKRDFHPLLLEQLRWFVDRAEELGIRHGREYED